MNNDENKPIMISEDVLNSIPISSPTNNTIENVNNSVQVSNQVVNQNPLLPDNSALSVNADEELIKAFVGDKYDDFKKSQFNLGGLLLSSVYLFYRKMFLYGLLVFAIDMILVNAINIYYITFGFNLFIAFFVNKLYLSFAKNKVDKIKAKYPQKSLQELKEICARKGGTTVGLAILGFILELVITIILVFTLAAGTLIAYIFHYEVNKQDDGVTPKTSENAKSIENVVLNNYGCFGNKCTITISGVDYIDESNTSEYLDLLSTYSDKFVITLYYNESDNKNYITQYKIVIKSTNEDISNIKDLSEIKSKIGLPGLGSNTLSMTLKEIGTPGVGVSGGVQYSYSNFVFVNNNTEYKMKYKNPPKDLNLVVNNTYNVTFEVTQGYWGDEYIITNIA